MLFTTAIPSYAESSVRNFDDSSIEFFSDGSYITTTIQIESIVNGAIDAISKADTLIIGGTSLIVYPAAGLINYFRGENLVLINKSQTSCDHKATLVIHQPIGQVLGQIKVE